MLDVAEHIERISLADAFRRFGVPISTLRDWLNRGQLERYYDRGRVMVDVAQLKMRMRTWQGRER